MYAEGDEEEEEGSRRERETRLRGMVSLSLEGISEYFSEDEI